MARGDAVEQIKERLSIVDVISPYVELHKAGKSMKGLSPFTSEKTPSFHVSPERGMYYCFSSSQGGDMFTFIEKMEGVDFKGALKILAEKAGVELVPEDPKKRTERDQQYALIEEATQFFFKNREKHNDIKKYIEKRGVEGKTVHVWRIGYALDDWRTLRTHLASKKFTDNQMRKAGLIKDADGGKEPYDVFRDRVMFPIADSSGRVVAFSGRTLKKDDKTPKYVNSPETDLFQKSEILYGYDKAKEGIRKFDFSLIVEGQFDVVLAHQAGYTNTVAVSGTALTPHHVGLLVRLSNKVVLALDADRAGVAAMKRGAEIMLRRGMDVKVARIPAGKDPADIVREEGKEALKKVIGSAVHVIEFLLLVLKNIAKDDRAYKLQVREEIIPLLAVMPNRIDREHFEKVLAEHIETTVDAIHYEVERIAAESLKQDQRDNGQSKPAHFDAGISRKDTLIAYFYAMTPLLDASVRAPLQRSFEIALDGVLYSDPDPKALAKLAFELEAQLEIVSERELKNDLVEKLNDLYELVTKEQLAQLNQELKRSEQEGNQKKADTLIGQIDELQKRLKIRVFQPTIFDEN